MMKRKRQTPKVKREGERLKTKLALYKFLTLTLSIPKGISNPKGPILNPSLIHMFDFMITFSLCFE
jgi:hypothetical protein